MPPFSQQPSMLPLQVYVIHAIESDMFPRFLRSQHYVLYAQMQQFAFTREAMARAGFKWLKVSGASVLNDERI